MNQFKFTKKYYINYYDTDFNGNLKITRLLDFLNNTSTLQSESLGVGLDYLYNKNLAWVICKMEVDILTLPKFNETIYVTTYTKGCKKYFAGRIFEIFNEENILICRGEFLYFLINISTRKPIKIPSELMNIFDENISSDLPPVSELKIKMPVGNLNVFKFKALNSHIDSNFHVNNGIYLELAENSTPFDTLKMTNIKSISVVFKKEILVNEEIIVSTQIFSNNDLLDCYYEVKDNMSQVKASIQIKRISK